MIEFKITPVPKPRMTRADAWKKRSCVLRYWKFKDELNLLAKQVGYTFPDSMEVLFTIPMPVSWSKKKKREMNGQPHKSSGDVDNFGKAFLDALYDEDKHVWKITLIKIWGYHGKITVKEM